MQMRRLSSRRPWTATSAASKVPFSFSSSPPHPCPPIFPNLGVQSVPVYYCDAT
jgi:hypothetical protein